MNKKSLFIKAMGNSPVIKVLDFLIENDNRGSAPMTLINSAGPSDHAVSALNMQAHPGLFAHYGAPAVPQYILMLLPGLHQSLGDVHSQTRMSLWDITS